MSKPLRVLFVCVHNSARSQLAEGLLRAMMGKRVQVFSAGSAPSSVNPLALRVLAERGIDASHHRSKSVNEFANDQFDYVITLCAEEVCPVFLGATHKLHWALPDPAAVQGDEALRLAAFRQTAAELEKRLREFIHQTVGAKPCASSLLSPKGSTMHILVTNDDGVTAPGILALAQEMRALGRVTVLAPDRNWSASGHVKTLDRPLRVKPVILADGTSAWACDGAPSDCVSLAVHGFVEEKIDLVVSGINAYANVGHDVTYSGTVTAAMEATIWEIPAIAFSLDQPESHTAPVDYTPGARVARRVARAVLRYGLPKNVLLNVNIPFLPEEQIKGFRISRQGMRVYHDKLDRRIDPRGRPYYWVIGESPTSIPERGTDAGTLAEGYVSITPIQLDLTAYQLMPEIDTWEWDDPMNPVANSGLSDSGHSNHHSQPTAVGLSESA